MRKFQILLYSASGRSSREWYGFAVDEDEAIKAAEEKHPGYGVHTVGEVRSVHDRAEVLGRMIEVL